MYCTKCGAVLAQGAVFCTACGTSAGAQASPSAVAPAPAYAPPPPAPPVYAPPPAAVGGGAPAAWSQPAAAPSTVSYAGFWLRFVAYLIDALIVGIPIGVVILIIVLVSGAGAFLQGTRLPDNPDVVAPWIAMMFGGAFLAIFAVAILGGWLYYAMSESSPWQGTLGKKALSLYVTDLNGQRVTFGRASGRYFSKLITGLVPLAIGYIMAGFTARKQALHDMIAGCLVLRRS